MSFLCRWMLQYRGVCWAVFDFVIQIWAPLSLLTHMAFGILVLGPLEGQQARFRQVYPPHPPARRVNRHRRHELRDRAVGLSGALSGRVAQRERIGQRLFGREV